MFESGTFASGQDGVIRFTSANPFEFYHILNALPESPQQPMFGSLILPDRGTVPCPLVVCAHGSMGWRGHHHEHMAKFVEAGMAVFRLHSFEARRVVSVVQDQLAVTIANVLTDAVAALVLLQGHPAINQRRVAIAGWSLGGSAALYAAWEPLMEQLAPGGMRFAAHLSFYPAAHIWPEVQRWSNAPVLSLIGALDDYTPPDLLQQLSAAINDSGGNSRVTLYPDGHHAFDSMDPVVYVSDARRVGNRVTHIDAQGEMYFIGSNGERFSQNNPDDRQTMFEGSKNTLGAHLGRNWAARRAALNDAVHFLAAALSAPD